MVSPQTPTLSRVETVWCLVEFLGLVHALQQCHLATFKTFWIFEWKCTNFTVEVLHNNYRSCNLIGPYQFWGMSLWFVHQTILTGRCVWAGHETTMYTGTTLSCDLTMVLMWFQLVIMWHLYIAFICSYYVATLVPRPVWYFLQVWGRGYHVVARVLLTSLVIMSVGDHVFVAQQSLSLFPTWSFWGGRISPQTLSSILYTVSPWWMNRCPLWRWANNSARMSQSLNCDRLSS